MAYSAEVIVVGGGPAGSTLAGYLAEQDVDVLVLDKEFFPRSKPCAGGVTSRALAALGFSLPETIVREKCYTFRAVYGDTVREASFEEPYVFTVDRKELDTFLLKRARGLGAKVQQGEKVITVESTRSGIVVQTETASYRAPLVVGADGIPSRVARLVGHQGPVNAAACLCADVPWPEENSDRFHGTLETHWGLSRWGYAWVFPKKDHLSIGLGTWDRGQQNLKALWTSFVQSQGLPLVKAQGHLIPEGGKTKNQVTDNLLLVGDAAGFADPLTGEGLYYAFMSAQIAAETILALKKQGLAYTGNNLARYEKTCWQLFGQDLRCAMRLNKIAKRYPKLWQQAFRVPVDWFARALQVVQGKASYRQMYYWTLPRLPLLWAYTYAPTNYMR
ncbi:MAG: NAD(P)/FAD-dependent oxidoreductase [Firmicutes bacterium]|nr:NAD(P)/FAD-dependent oxidoreductase [Bacillota bacterium]